MKANKPIIIVPCPDCEENIKFETPPEQDHKVMCPHCWADLKVINLEPLELGWDVVEYEEDWGLD